MKFPQVLILMLFCSLTSVQVGSQTTTNSGLQSNSPEISDLLKQIGALERRLQESENQIAELKNKATTRVAFSAVAGGGDAGGYIGPFGWDTTFIFKKVLTNIGNAYNNDTGIFTAPVTGLYYFGFFHHAQTLYTSGLFLIKNDENIVMTYDHPSKEDRADNAGNVVLLELQKDDRVYLRLGGSSAVWGHDYITTFSGFLLSQE